MVLAQGDSRLALCGEGATAATGYALLGGMRLALGWPCFSGS